MEFLLYLLLLALVVYAIRWMRSGPDVGKDARAAEPAPVDEDDPLAIYRANEALLEERWRMAGASAHAQREIELPRWYYEPPDRWQLDWLERQRLPVELEQLTKGQASDVIGLFQAPQEEDLELLRFFGEPAGTLSRTAARQRAARLLGDPQRRERWERGGATMLQREFFRFIGETPPEGVSNGEARQIIEDRLADHGEELAREWEIFLRLYEEINARAGEYHIASVGPELFGRAVAGLRHEQGRSMTQLEMNPDLLVDRLLELAPQLELE